MRLHIIAVLAATIAGGASAALAQPSAPASAAPAAVATSSAEVRDGTRKDGVIRFTLIGSDFGFMAREAALPDANAFWNALTSSNGSHRSLLVQFDPKSGVFEAGQDEPTFVVRVLTYDGIDIAGDPTAVAAVANDPVALAKARLAEAVARAQNIETQAALEASAQALEGDRLPTPLRVLALRLRADIYSDEAGAQHPPGMERDRLLVAALEADRAWLKLAPGDHKAEMHEAGVLRDLGAYDEALALFAKLAADGVVNDQHWSLIRQGAIYRIRGENEKALAMLDELKAKVPDLGMAYYYHRGWTLTELGRFSEAVAALTEGLKTQPDYWGAFDQRACALGRMGRVRDALGDLQEADRLARAWTSKRPAPTQSTVQTNAYRTRLIAKAQGALAQSDRTPVDLCGFGWDFGEHRHDRSPLLPPAA